MRFSLVMLALMVTLAGGACKQDTLAPTGGLKITYTLNQALPSTSLAFSLATEALYGKGPSLTTNGTIQAISATQYQIVIDDLNPGNYVISFNASNNTVQVTGGKQREYNFR
ncbi:hypothetical protein [uncultured Fibrella sp.]|uniref:hypothetical protein n=1 Tax=uncultured Fibrella sp. TaxID=1284596 RepID=UPI0035CB9F69